MKKVIALIATLLVASLALAGCGSTDTASSGAAQKNTSRHEKTLKVGATAVPHRNPRSRQTAARKRGHQSGNCRVQRLRSAESTLNDKELDANFFQHEPYLKNFMEEHKEVKLKKCTRRTHRANGRLLEKVKDLKDLKDGAAIAHPK